MPHFNLCTLTILHTSPEITYKPCCTFRGALLQTNAYHLLTTNKMNNEQQTKVLHIHFKVLSNQDMHQLNRVARNVWFISVHFILLKYNWRTFPYVSLCVRRRINEELCWMEGIHVAHPSPCTKLGDIKTQKFINKCRWKMDSINTHAEAIKLPRTNEEMKSSHFFNLLWWKWSSYFKFVITLNLHFPPPVPRIVRYSYQLEYIQ